MEEKISTVELEYTEEWTSEGEEVDYVTYNGVAFTGIEYKETEHWYSETKYLNGYAHGRSFTVFTNGRQSAESLKEHGVTLEETRWYAPENLRHQRQPAQRIYAVNRRNSKKGFGEMAS